MRYLLDTTVLSPYFAGDPQARLFIRQLSPDGIAVSILSYLEAIPGGDRECRSGAGKAAVQCVLSAPPRFCPVSPAVARRCAEIRSLLKSQGKQPRKRAFDLVIAATALEHGLEIVTHNTKDFQDIPDLVRYQI